MPVDDAGMAQPVKSPTPPRPNRAFYPNKLNGVRVQGTLSPSGGTTFDKVRKKLAQLSERDFARISDADVIEYAVTVDCYGAQEALKELERNGIVK